MTTHRRSLAQARVDLTPMIDVTFLLLIFFLCTLSFRVLEGKLESHLPKDVGESASPTALHDQLELFDVALEPDARAKGGVRIVAQRRVLHDARALGDTVRRSRAVDPELRVKLHVDGRVTHGQVVDVVDALVATGQERILFAGGG